MIRDGVCKRVRPESLIGMGAGPKRSLVLTGPFSDCSADRRTYGETYEAVTAPKGELDIEMWHTYAGDGELLNGPASKGYRGMLELEYGITSR